MSRINLARAAVRTAEFAAGIIVIRTQVTRKRRGQMNWQASVVRQIS
jgi:hypothetical protein